MRNKILLDTNVIIRLLMRDNEEHYKIAQSFFVALEAEEKHAILLDIIIGEIVYVLKSFYKQDKKYIADRLKLLLQYENLEVSNRAIIIEALEVYEKRNIDFADAILCAKKNLEGYEVMSFDKDLKRC
ncbi:MAG TPA: PIN domain-containing protein [Sulfurimonas autotrophica]|nr:PIN domain-containing protein [Sulfurimonas autotrophica]